MLFSGARLRQVLARQAVVDVSPQQEVAAPHWLWALGSLCALHGRPFAPELITREFPPPSTHSNFLAAARALGLDMRRVQLPVGDADSAQFARVLRQCPLPLVLEVRPAAESSEAGAATHLAILTSITDLPGDDPASGGGPQALLFEALTNTPLSLSAAELRTRLTGPAWAAKPRPEPVADGGPAHSASPPGHATSQIEPGTQSFGFRWFVPELLKHRGVWRDVLLASLALQVIALATPLFTQAIIDKVVVHRTQSTLVAIGIAMALFTVFSSLLSWVRQFLVLHTGNRVDAVLGASVWQHLLALPLRYFQHRPTGVVAARLHGVETIREFVSGAAISLVLDLPFLLICLGLMLWYSPLLSAVAVGMLGVIAVASLLVAPVFQARLAEQFQLGARNQAFVTEHIAGFETVKSLQMEPLLRQRYAGYLASYLQSGFRTKQIANTYNVAASTIEQLMTLAILMVGAWQVMTEPSFTIGMLVAFQMFAGKLSQPVMRIVGLWTQFQQARLAVQRLGDVMNAPAEPYTLQPRRQQARQGAQGEVEIIDLSFSYAPDLPPLYQHLSLRVAPGEAVAIMGPSGCGKSTLAKLLQGFYAPSSGQIKLNGVDTRHLAANELRQHFGVVPQETTLFSGSILDNIKAGNPAASFEAVVQAATMAQIHSAIEALPQGYLTEIGERGAGLSGGQKQRLAIARALLKRPQILIFDEATSALDADTAESFAATINGLRGKVTMLLIAHGLPRALVVDRKVNLCLRAASALAGIQTQKPLP